MPIELSDEDKQALLNLGPNLQAIEQELKRAEAAGINVQNLRSRFQTVVTQHAGLVTHYVQNSTVQRRRTNQ